MSIIILLKRAEHSAFIVVGKKGLGHIVIVQSITHICLDFLISYYRSFPMQIGLYLRRLTVFEGSAFR